MADHASREPSVERRPYKIVLEYAREGRLPCLRNGKHVRFVRSELDEVLLAQRGSRRGP
jgi:hypothetical protein